jgi:uncharacterized integral membrane protein (TIGR02327 family)
MDQWSVTEKMIGYNSAMNLIEIVIYLVAIGISWWALQEVRFDVFLKRPKSRAAKLLQLLLSIALGYGVGGFLTHYVNLSVRIGFF